MGCVPRPRGLPAASSHWGRATIGHEELIVLIGQIWPGLHARRGNGARWDEPERARPPQARADFRSERDFWQLSYGHRMGILAWAKECTGLLDHARSVADFLKQVQSAKIAPCDAPALRILGLSLAGWNALISTGLAALAVLGLHDKF